METREITQYRIYALRMNHAADRAESIRTVAASFSYDALVRFYQSQYTPELLKNPYGCNVHFIPGPLHFYNTIYSTELNQVGVFGDGIVSGWIDEDDYGQFASEIHIVPEDFM